VLKNAGSEAIELSKMGACCGASVELSRSVLLPGTEAAVRVKLSLLGRSGEQRKSIYVRSSDPQCRVFELQLKGVALAKVDVQPSTVTLDAAAGETAAGQTVNIVCMSNISFTVTNIVSTSGLVVAEYAGRTGNCHRVTVKTRPLQSPGVSRDVVLVLTDHPKYGKIEIPVLTRVLTDLMVVPEEILLVRKPGLPATRPHYAIVRSRSNTPFKIIGTETPDSGVEIISKPAAGGGYKLEMRNFFPMTDLDGRHVIIRTDHETVKEIAVPIRVLSLDALPR
jgi:hypothetical protein